MDFQCRNLEYLNLVRSLKVRYVIFFRKCFFFQAEDGIRDPEMSRGLGDVYKRQVGVGLGRKAHFRPRIAYLTFKNRTKLRYSKFLHWKSIKRVLPHLFIDAAASINLSLIHI